MTGAILKYVLGVDPGTTTGLALVRFQRDHEPHLSRCAQLPWDLAAERIMQEVRWLSVSPLTAVVCESYTLNAKSAQRGQSGAEDAMEMNGVARYACYKYGVDFAPRQKSSVKNAATDASLKAAGLYQRGHKHANDAIRHCLVYGMAKDYFDARIMIP